MSAQHLNEDPHVTRLREFESLCEPLPDEEEWGDWSEGEEMKRAASELFFYGCADFGSVTVAIDELVDGISECFLCRLRSISDVESYGRGRTPANAILAALVHMEVVLMLRLQ